MKEDRKKIQDNCNHNFFEVGHPHLDNIVVMICRYPACQKILFTAPSGKILTTSDHDILIAENDFGLS